MTPEDITAALGYFCGSGRITVRHDDTWTEIWAHTASDPQVVELADLFLILTAEEVRT